MRLADHCVVDFDRIGHGVHLSGWMDVLILRCGVEAASAG